MAVINGTVVGAEAGFYPKEIEQSLRFNDDDSAYLSWTPASAGNRKTWTWSGWVKVGTLGVNRGLFGAQTTAGSDTNRLLMWLNSSDKIIVYEDISTTGNTYRLTTQVFRDPSAWYHIVLAFDTSNATAGDRVKLYVNGSQITAFDTNNAPTLNRDTFVNAALPHSLGADRASSLVAFDGYLAETHFIDGTALDATAFGEFKSDVWIAKAPSVTYGSNGFYLDYSNGASIGADSSGNGNNWTPTNLASTDVMLDSPTNNFATLNPLDGQGTQSEGNLQLTSGTTAFRNARGTAWANSGKYYFEFMAKSWSTATTRVQFGIAGKDQSLTAQIGTSADSYSTYLFGGSIYKRNNNSNTALTSTGNLAFGDVIMCAVDYDNNKIWFGRNGTWFDSGNPATGANSLFTLADDYYTPMSCTYSDGTIVNNFGQDSSFAGNKTPQGYTDANGRGDFYYAPPAGYLALCTANLPEPAIGPNSASTSDEHFNTVLYTGNGTSQSITGVGFQPDLNWIKQRGGAYVAGHSLVDTVRGTDGTYLKELASNTTNAENTLNNTAYGGISSLDTDGFTVVDGNDANYGTYNYPSYSYVAWNWKASGTAGSSNTDGSITSTVSANVDAGFSIVSYTGTGSAATVGHGLSQAPEMVIIKNRIDAGSWPVYSSELTNAEALQLQSTTGKYATSNWNSTSATSSVFTVGAGNDVNGTGDGIIAYCFHSVPQFSKCFSYTGNGSTDGTFVFLDFEPAFIMVKRTDSTGEWAMYDNDRSTYNVAAKKLQAQSSSAEIDPSSDAVDFLSNGFKLRGSTSGTNASGGSYIGIAFAKNPLKYGNAQ